MLSKAQRKLQLCLAENASLLYHVTKAPTDAKDNPCPSTAVANDPRRTLSFDDEVCLTSTLAYISAISDDPNHVIAVCVEELPDRKSIRIVIAINKERPDSQDEVLKRIKDGLAVVLSHLACSGQSVFPCT
jgi:hypothetical protein